MDPPFFELTNASGHTVVTSLAFPDVVALGESPKRMARRLAKAAQAHWIDEGHALALAQLCNELVEQEVVLCVGHLIELFEVGQYQGSAISLGRRGRAKGATSASPTTSRSPPVRTGLVEGQRSQRAMCRLSRRLVGHHSPLLTGNY